MLRRALGVAALTVCLVLALATPAFAAWSFGCISNQNTDCWWSLTAGGPQPVSTDRVYRPASSGSEVVDPCIYVQATQPPPDDPGWGGRDPAHGRLWYPLCPDDFGETSWDGSGNTMAHYAAGDPFYVPDGQTPDGAAAAVNPMSLVDRARGTFQFPAPSPVFGPDESTVAVKVPVWLSVAPFAPVVQSAQAGGLTATVTAELAETVWSMGEPRDPAVPGFLTAPVTCAGSGAEFAMGMDPGSPPCGYTYIWRSLASRTSGSGAWTVSVTARYRVSWEVTGAAGVALSGSDTVETTASVPLVVREWHSILVNELPRN